MKGLLAASASTVLGLTIWQAVVWGTELPKFILPGPKLVAETIWTSRALLAEHAFITIIEVIFGAILGGISAIGLAASPFGAIFV